MLKHFISARLNCHNGSLRIFIIFYLFKKKESRESTKKRAEGQRQWESERETSESESEKEEERDSESEREERTGDRTAGRCINFNWL